MKIVLDFDDTIFNTHQLMQEVLAVFNGLGFQEEQFWDAYKECKKRVGDFDSEILINLLSELKSFDKEKVSTEIDSIISKSRNFVYPDFFDFAKNFNKKDLILLSFGTIDFQGMKIKNSGIIPYFQEIIITEKDKTDDLKNILIKNKGEKIFFIDDKAEQIDKVKEKLPQIIAMKMERPQGGHINTESKLTDHIVKDLNEVKNICKTGAKPL
jgi:FMN phosphatase YigB (HAD superfamily)